MVFRKDIPGAVDRADVTKGKLVYSVPECAEALGVGRNTAYAAVKSGQLPSIRIGRRILIPKSALGL
jgi:excisionase family DNA binding protein